MGVAVQKIGNTSVGQCRMLLTQFSELVDFVTVDLCCDGSFLFQEVVVNQPSITTLLPGGHQVSSACNRSDYCTDIASDIQYFTRFNKRMVFT